MRFLNKKLEENNMSQIENTVIDTMQISRAIYNTSRHSLGAIANNLKLEYNDEIAHRADFDAEILSKV
jgi:DNA polymerase-3 subunit alpha (Gram-positive type)